MSELTILIDQGQSGFTPGSLLKGTIQWNLDRVPQSLRLQLLWFTSGKGGTDVETADSLDFSPSRATGKEPFQFALPAAPYSFSGKLISLRWALELVSEPGSLNHRIEFTLSPSGEEIILPAIEIPLSQASFQKFTVK